MASRLGGFQTLKTRPSELGLMSVEPDTSRAAAAALIAAAYLLLLSCCRTADCSFWNLIILCHHRRGSSHLQSITQLAAVDACSASLAEVASSSGAVQAVHLTHKKGAVSKGSALVINLQLAGDTDNTSTSFTSIAMPPQVHVLLLNSLSCVTLRSLQAAGLPQPSTRCNELGSAFTPLHSVFRCFAQQRCLHPDDIAAAVAA
jgi:hypothetical protein